MVFLLLFFWAGRYKDIMWSQQQNNLSTFARTNPASFILLLLLHQPCRKNPTQEEKRRETECESRYRDETLSCCSSSIFFLSSEGNAKQRRSAINGKKEKKADIKTAAAPRCKVETSQTDRADRRGLAESEVTCSLTLNAIYLR